MSAAPRMQGWMHKIPSTGGAFSTKKKRYFFSLFAPSATGVGRLEYREDEKGKGHAKGLIRLKDLVSCARIKISGESDAFEVSTTERSYLLVAGNKYQCDLWISSICDIGLPNQPGLTAPEPLPPDGLPPSPPKQLMPLPALPGASSPRIGISTSVLAENLVYASGSQHNFDIVVEATDAAKTLGLAGPRQLQITPVNITLVDAASGQVSCVFPLRYLRRYGRGGGVFTFEAGRKCATGPGLFGIVTDEASRVFRLVDSYTRDMLKNKAHSLQATTPSSHHSTPPIKRSPAGIPRSTVPTQPDSIGVYSQPTLNTVVDAGAVDQQGVYQELGQSPDAWTGYGVPPAQGNAPLHGITQPGRRSDRLPASIETQYADNTFQEGTGEYEDFNPIQYASEQYARLQVSASPSGRRGDGLYHRLSTDDTAPARPQYVRATSTDLYDSPDLSNVDPLEIHTVEEP